jgi:glutaminyl-tRNA synthetase
METSNFVKTIIEDDIKSGKHDSIVTRFPPEPNGYLHIGHAKAICVDFGMAKKYGGRCHLRFDDTNPSKEETEYVESIKEDVQWLGFDWGEHLYFASDYFEKMVEYAIELIKKEKAYVCHLTFEEMRKYRGTLKEPGKESPYRNRSVEENLDLFEKMKNGKMREGDCVLRAKIDMASPNINMRDPIIYRVLKAEHHHAGAKWNIYPIYDFAHCLEDSIEGITHSLCTLEFEDHRPLYDWYLDQLDVDCHPQQIEFARLELTYTVLSKRKLIELVQQGIVDGWDDPRMPTVAGFRAKGYTPTAIQDFCERIGVSKANSMVDLDYLQFCLKEELNKTAERRMAVLDPIKLIIENYPEDQEELLDADNNQEDESAGKRKIPFSKELYIEREDFLEDAPKKYFRLAPDKEVRLNHAYYVTCTGFKKDDAGNVVEVYATYDPATKGGWSDDGRKVKGSIHWISAKHAVDAKIKRYDHLFTQPNMNKLEAGKEYKDYINPESLVVLENCKLEPSLLDAPKGVRYQFLRKGYFWKSPESTAQELVYQRILPLRDKWVKLNQG